MLDTIIQLLKDASILVSLFTLVGCIIQRKSVNDTIISVTKTFLGFVLLFASARLMISPSLHSFSDIFMMRLTSRVSSLIMKLLSLMLWINWAHNLLRQLH